MDHFLDVGGTSEYDVELCKECIEWARDEKRNFLRQALEVWPVSVVSCSQPLFWYASLFGKIRKRTGKRAGYARLCICCSVCDYQ